LFYGNWQRTKTTKAEAQVLRAEKFGTDARASMRSVRSAQLRVRRWVRQRGGSTFRSLSPESRMIVVVGSAVFSGVIAVLLLSRVFNAPSSAVDQLNHQQQHHNHQQQQQQRHHRQKPEPDTGTSASAVEVPKYVLDSLQNNSGRGYDSSTRSTRRNVLDQIAIGIKSGREVQRKRMEVAWAAWLSRAFDDLSNIVIVSDVSHPPNSPREPTPLESVDVRRVASELLSELRPQQKDDSVERLRAAYMPALDAQARGLFHGGWGGDKDKNLPALAYLYARFPGRRVYLLIDDDTFLFVDNLVHALQHDKALSEFWFQAFQAPLYGGRLFLMVKCMGYAHGNRSNPKFAHGGSGIVVNHAAMEALAPHIPECVRDLPSRCYAGDMQVAVCLAQRANVPQVKKLLPFQGEHLSWALLGPPASSRAGAALWNSSVIRIATMHQLPQHEIRLLADFERDTHPNDRSFRALKLYALSHNLTFTPRKWWHKTAQPTPTPPTPSTTPIPLERRR